MTRRERQINARRYAPHVCNGCGSPARFKQCRDGVWRWVCTFAARCC